MPCNETTEKGDTKPQSDKFKDLAREVGADEDEAAFDAKLRKVAAAPKRSTEDPKPGTEDGR